jgi:hypothetical protein
VKRLVGLALLVLGASASRTFAAEFSAKSTLSESVAASNNYFLTTNPTGYTAKPLSRIDLDFLAATPTTQYSLTGDYSYYKYFGPGADSQPLKVQTPADAVFRIDNKPDALTKDNLTASWHHTDLATTLLEQTGTASGHGYADTFHVSGGRTRNISAVDTISWTANASTVSYTDSTQTPYIDLATNAAWYHHISAATVLFNTISFDYLDSDDPPKSQRLFWNPMTGFQSQVTKRLNISGAIGAALVNAYQLNPANGAQTSLITPGSGQNVVGNISFAYKATHDTQALLKLSQAITPSVLGTLSKIDSIGLTVAHNINFRSSLTFLAQYSHELATGQQQSDFFTASASYAYRWSREWRSALSVTYRERTNSSGFASSGTVLASLTRDISLYGKPAPRTTTGNDLARIQQQTAQQALPTVIPYSTPDSNTEQLDLTPQVTPSTDF